MTQHTHRQTGQEYRPSAQRRSRSEREEMQSARERERQREARRLAQKRAREQQVKRIRLIAAGAGAALLLILVLVISSLVRRNTNSGSSQSAGNTETAATKELTVSSLSSASESAPASLLTKSGSPDTDPAAVTPTAAAMLDNTQEEIAFSPYSTEETKPTVLMDYSEIQYNGETLEDKSLYEPWYSIDFKTGSHYAENVDGIITFRGNSFRDDPTVGTVGMSKYTINKLWSTQTGVLEYNDRIWSGNGWTGQPLMVRWPEAVKQHMNMYDSAKQDSDLVEIIYASMDGYIYFLNLKTGERTRDPMYVGWTFKGAGALDPRGYPILYVGAGYNSENGTSRAFIINLLDCSIMYSFGAEDDFSLRGTLSYFDSSALVDAASDTLIYPGENGILYVMHLNTDYNESEGTLSIDPDKIAKWHYWGKRTSDESYWLGMEDSACIYKNYCFVCDNGGHMMCIDLNALKFVWVQDILDDSNGSPVLSIEDGHLYLYISTSFHLGWRSDSTATIPIWKIDAENGEIVWQHDYECFTLEGISGGVQSTIASGKHALEDYIYVTVSMTLNDSGGICACLNKETGEVVWEHEAAYAWSSPVCVYNSDGSGNVIYCSSNGTMFLLDGVTGQTKDSYSFGETTLEASPAVYENYLVVGTRDCEICGFQLE